MILILILSGYIEARACDWAVEEKGWARSFREGEKSEEKGRQEGGTEREEYGGRGLEDGAEPRGLGRLKVAKYLTVGE